MRAFEAAARLRSFKQAADELAVTATAISHRIRVLEADLERPLFVRKVRAVELTGDGQILAAAVSSGFQAMAVAVEQIRRPRRAAVTLAATPAFATKWLVPKLGAFQAAHPDIDLHVQASNAPVDLEAGAVDLAIRYGHGHYPGVTATLLLADRFAPVANPALLARVGQDVSQWPLIHFDWHRPPAVELTWSAWARTKGDAFDGMLAGIRYSEESHAIQAAVAGQGVALLSLLLVEEELRMGVLQVAAEPVLEGMSYHLLNAQRRPLSAAAATVHAWVMHVACNTPAERPGLVLDS